MKCLLWLTVPLVLSGCATKYVTVKCVTSEQAAELAKAEPPKVADKLTGKADEDTRTLAGSAVRLRSYAHGLLGVIQGCSE